VHARVAGHGARLGGGRPHGRCHAGPHRANERRGPSASQPPRVCRVGAHRRVARRRPARARPSALARPRRARESSRNHGALGAAPRGLGPGVALCGRCPGHRTARRRRGRGRARRGRRPVRCGGGVARLRGRHPSALAPTAGPRRGARRRRPDSIQGAAGVVEVARPETAHRRPVEAQGQLGRSRRPARRARPPPAPIAAGPRRIGADRRRVRRPSERAAPAHSGVGGGLRRRRAPRCGPARPVGSAERPVGARRGGASSTRAARLRAQRRVARRVGHSVDPSADRGGRPPHRHVGVRRGGHGAVVARARGRPAQPTPGSRAEPRPPARL
jgi:hypothetical protein